MKRIILLLCITVKLFCYNVEMNCSNKSKSIIGISEYVTNFTEINRILKIDLRKELIKINKKDNYNANNNMSEILQIKYIGINICFNSSNDYFIDAFIQDKHWWKNSAKIYLILTKQDNKYKVSYKYFGTGDASYADASVIDIDYDGKYELLLIYDISGNQSASIWADIYKYDNGKKELTCIFNQGMIEEYGIFPYSYNNTFCFQKGNKSLDIVLYIDTKVGKVSDLFEEPYKSKYIKLLNGVTPVKQEVKFIFDGKRYVVPKEMYNYRKYIIEYLK